MIQTDTKSVFHPLQDDIDGLRTDALKRLAALMVSLAVGLLCVGVTNPDTIGVPRIWIVVFLLVGPAATGWWLVRRAYTGAAIALIAGLAASAIVAAGLYSWNQVLFCLPVVFFLTPLLIGYARACLFSGGLGIFLVLLHVRAIASFADADVLTIVALSALGLVLSWIAYRPISASLDWAWASYEREQRKTDEVRLRQGELAQMSKSLAEACERLEQVNLALYEARKVAEEARLLKDQFVTTISHELRTPLNLIIGFSDMIVNGPATGAAMDVIPEPLRRDLETIYRNSCHLSTLVDDVLDLGRLDAHRLAMRKEWSDLSKVVLEAITSVSALYERSGLCVTTLLPPDLPSLYLDPTRIRQVLINLLANAVRYVEEGGVQVTARRDGGDVVVSVADTGIGIPLDDLPYVFEPFRQTGQFRRRGGFGLGLTVSKQFVEMHGGAMWVESRIDRGTTFRFTLPVTDNVADVASGSGLRSRDGAYPSQRTEQSILLLDRDAETTRVFERYLDDFQVVAAASVPEVTRLGRTERISSVVAASAGDQSTDDLLEVALRDHPNIPIVRCAMRTRSSAGRDLGAAAFLGKPVSREEIRATLRRLKLRPRRVLIVDDEPEMLRLLGVIFRTIAPRCLIRTAADGEQALRVAATGFGTKYPDLVLLDLLMPNLDGRGFLQTWSADPARRVIPVIVVSAASEENHDVITCDSVEIRRRGGMSVAELIQVIRGGLTGLNAAPIEMAFPSNWTGDARGAT